LTADDWMDPIEPTQPPLRRASWARRFPAERRPSPATGWPCWAPTARWRSVPPGMPPTMVR